MAQAATERETGGRRPVAAGGVAAVAAAAVAAAAAGCAGAPAAHPAAATTPHHSAASSGPAATRATARPTPSGGPTVLPVPPAQGHLPQTRVLPRAHTPGFAAEMTDLWAAVASGHAGLAAPSFFPLDAYRQIKAIYDPAADWHGRLFADFRLDVAAAHRYLGPHPARARLVRVLVPSAEAAWIPPGVCSNSGGYWHVGGARLVYEQNGRLRSIGIASLISWRGRWYVVHFGAVLRSAAAGVVDQPAAGPGVPGPPGGC